ncbi:SDR family NAD(P)-dependent oxidoreductase [Candidatus Pacearchaeota archaeon]|nr:SDR family NAD(P)-dependent oxidoreductase [Candidatus Pacearchaeota archaeon]
MAKIVFITGASRGIGKALAEKFLKEGYEVIGTSTSGKATILNKSFTNLKLDLSSEKSIMKCAEDFKKLNKKIDILINNAGTWSGKDEGPEVYMDSLRKVLEVNLIGTIDLTEKLIPFVNDSGKIINISSRAGSLAYTRYVNYPDYRISKAALNMYTRTLATKLASKKILSASIHPGWVETDMGGEGADLKPAEAADNIFDRITTLTETGKFWFKNEEFPW